MRAEPREPELDPEVERSRTAERELWTREPEEPDGLDWTRELVGRDGLDCTRGLAELGGLDCTRGLGELEGLDCTRGLGELPAPIRAPSTTRRSGTGAGRRVAGDRPGSTETGGRVEVGHRSSPPPPPITSRLGRW